MRRLSACSHAAAGLLVPALAALALAAPAGSATIPLAKARKAAAKRLFDYVWSLSYVTNYELTTCTRRGGGVACGYQIVFNMSQPCSGTILVGYRGRSVTSRFSGALCTTDAPPPAPPASTTPVAPPPPPVTVPTTGTTTTTVATATTTAATTTAATTTSSTPAYAGVGVVHSLDSVEGSTVKLDDGSRWQASGSVSDWIFDDAIEVAYAGGVYTLTDDATGTSVTAIYLG